MFRRNRRRLNGCGRNFGGGFRPCMESGPRGYGFCLPSTSREWLLSQKEFLEKKLESIDERLENLDEE